MTDLDVLARAAVERARQEAASVDVPRVNDVTARRAASHQRRRLAGTALLTVIVAGGVFAVAATRNDEKRPSITVEPTTVPAVRHAAALAFREMFSVKDFKGCTPTADNPRAEAVLPDRRRTYCYTVGPVILDGSSVGSANASLNPTISAWEINVHFRNDDFVTKVARPYVDKQIAIVVDGVVQSAPTINQGITGRDVTISGGFTRAEAEDLARRLGP
jgi:preprotein translocase subunit SecD